MNYDLVPVDENVKNLIIGKLPFESKYKVILEFFKIYQKKDSILKLIEKEDSLDKKSKILQFILSNCDPRRSDKILRSLSRRHWGFQRRKFDDFFIQDPMNVSDDDEDDEDEDEDFFSDDEELNFYDSSDEDSDDKEFKISIPKKNLNSESPYSFRKRKRENFSSSGEDSSEEEEVEQKKQKKK